MLQKSGEFVTLLKFQVINTLFDAFSVLSDTEKQLLPALNYSNISVPLKTSNMSRMASSFWSITSTLS